MMKRASRLLFFSALLGLAAFVTAAPAQAGIIVTNETDATNLENALLGFGGTGISVTSFTVS